MTTGWPPGLLQDDERKLSRWFASRLDARYQLRKNMNTQPEALRLADLLETRPLNECDEEAAAELRRLHAELAAMTVLIEQPVQEPVAWRTKNATPPGGYVVFQQYPQAVADLDGEIEPLYAAPQPRQWQGLTIAQIDRAANNIITDDPVQWWRQFARAIEAAHGIKGDA